MTISSEVQIYNLALNAIGERSNISSPSENSRPAEVCRLWYSPVRDQILSSAPWPEATRIASLALLVERGDEAWAETDPRSGYTYAYAAPDDMLRPIYMQDFSRFLVTKLGDQTIINSSLAQASLAYTSRLEEMDLWNAQLQMAVVYGLAANICMPITGKPSRAKVLADKANELILAAREQAANMSNEQFEHVPSWIAARGYNFSAAARYIYPAGGLLQIAA